MYDYHVHSEYSHDSLADPREMIKRAARAGLQEICFTEHVEYDENMELTSPLQIDEYAANIRKLKEDSPVTVKMGLEIGLKDSNSFERALNLAKGYDVDFIIGSVHWTDEGDAYFPPFFEGREKEQAYYRYLELALPRCFSSADYQVFGHFDYPAKKAPYKDRAMYYNMASGIFDRLFTYLIEHGIGIEVNTSVYRTMEEKMWGLDILKRYVELGGEFVTTGSDAHVPERVGFRIKEAMELARQAGVRYVATYEERKPFFHKL